MGREIWGGRYGEGDMGRGIWGEDMGRGIITISIPASYMTFLKIYEVEKLETNRLPSRRWVYLIYSKHVYILYNRVKVLIPLLPCKMRVRDSGIARYLLCARCRCILPQCSP